MNTYPPQLPPPQPPGGYNPFNPYQAYDQQADYIPWLPGRQGPRFIPIAIIVGVVLFCSCCSFFAGTIFGIELPGFLFPASAAQNQNDNNSNDQQQPQDEPTPESFMWHVTYPSL